MPGADASTRWRRAQSNSVNALCLQISNNLTMRVRRVQATNFGALGHAAIDLDSRVSVITGTNGVGKSTVLQTLALARDSVVLPRDLSPWADSLRFGQASFEVRVAIGFDEPSEQELLDKFVVAAICPLVHLENAQAGDGFRRVEAVKAALGERPARDLCEGELVVTFDPRRSPAFRSAWEFESDGRTAHIGLSGPTASRLWPEPFVQDRRAVHQVRSELTASTNNVTELIESGKVKVALSDIVAASEAVLFEVATPSNGIEIAAIQDVLAVGTSARERHDQSRAADRAQWSDVMGSLLSSSLVVTDNHRRSARTVFQADEVAAPIDLSDGSAVAAEMFVLKNGNSTQRSTFAAAQRIFLRLTDRYLDVTAGLRVLPVSEQANPAHNVTVELVPRISADTESDGWPLHRAGAGTAEALYLALALADRSRVVCLDEPGVHMSPTMQRRFLDLLDRAPEHDAQVIVVTHNPDLVPAGTPEAAASIVHLVSAVDEPPAGVTPLAPDGTSGATLITGTVRGARSTPGSQVSAGRLDAVRLSPSQLQALGAVRRLRANEFRSMLFAQGVILAEGEHDALLLTQWAGKAATTNPGLSIEQNNLVVHAVGGDTEFAGTAELLTAMRVPFVIVADGPALAPGSIFVRQFAKQGWTIPTGATLKETRNEWAALGVVTLASEYGNTGTKDGEIEAYMQRIDPDAFREASDGQRHRKGTELVREFCDLTEPADDFLALWRSVVARLVGG